MGYLLTYHLFAQQWPVDSCNTSSVHTGRHGTIGHVTPSKQPYLDQQCSLEKLCLQHEPPGHLLHTAHELPVTCAYSSIFVLI